MFPLKNLALKRVKKSSPGLVGNGPCHCQVSAWWQRRRHFGPRDSGSAWDNTWQDSAGRPRGGRPSLFCFRHPLLHSPRIPQLSYSSVQQADTCLPTMQMDMVTSLVPVKTEWNFILVIFKLILVIDGWGISCEIPLRWISLDLTDDWSTLVRVKAWYSQAASLYLRQCWPRFVTTWHH